MNQNFIEESSHFEQYISHCNYGEVHIECPAKEPPDIELTLNIGRIGIEHSRLKNEHISSREAFKEKIRHECETELKKICDDSFLVNCILIKQLEFDSKSRKHFVKTVVRLVHEAWKSKGSQNGRIVISSSLLPREVIELSIIPYEDEEKPLKWYLPKFWSVGSLKSQQLTEIVKIKSNKVSGIVDDYDQLWLFLVVEGNPTSDFASIDPVGFTFDDEWLFSRIIIFNLNTNESKELNKHST